MDLTAAVLTVSDRGSAGAPDLSGPSLARHVTAAGFALVDQAIVPDDQLLILSRLLHWADERRVHLIVTTGGTGAAPRDVTPEATRMAIERPFPGIAEAMRAESLKYTQAGLLSRGAAGSRGRTLIINFPGQPKAIDQLWPVISGVVAHACRLLAEGADPHPVQ